MPDDTAWFPTFLDAFFESRACIELPIWKVFRTDSDETRTALSEQGAWDVTWDRVYQLRARDPAGHYDCEHGIELGKLT